MAEDAVLPDLMPCPFCGSAEVSLWSDGSDHDWGSDWVECELCGTNGPLGSPSAEAVELWNTRRIGAF